MMKPIGVPGSGASPGIDSAVEAMRGGAHDYLPKPFTPQQIRHAVQQHRQRSSLEQKIADLEGQLSESTPEVVLNSESPPMRAVLVTTARAEIASLRATSELSRGCSGVSVPQEQGLELSF